MLLVGTASAFASIFALTPASPQDPPAKTAQPRPVLQVDDPVYAWGKVYRGMQVQHTFALTNAGEADLVIEEVKSHCGCTVVSGAEMKKRLLPGERTTITLNLDTTGLSGPVDKDTDVLSNASGETKLWMRGEVEELLKLDPPLPKVEYIRGSSLPPTAVTVNVCASLGKALVISAVRPLKGLLTAELKELEPGESYQLTLLPSAGNKEADAFQSEHLEFRVQVDGKTIDLRVQTSLVLRDRIDVSPSKSVYVHRKETEKLGKPGAPPVQKVLELTSLGGPEHRFEVKSVSSRNKLFDTKIETAQAGRQYRLTVTLVQTPQKGERFLKDTIEVATDDPLVPVVVIPAMAQF